MNDNPRDQTDEDDLDDLWLSAREVSFGYAALAAMPPTAPRPRLDAPWLTQTGR